MPKILQLIEALVGSGVQYLRVYPQDLWSRTGRDGLFNSLNASGMHIAELSHSSV